MRYRCVMPLYIYRLDKQNLAIYGYARRHFSTKGWDHVLAYSTGSGRLN